MKERPKAFVFLYPEQDIIDYEISTNWYTFVSKGRQIRDEKAYDKIESEKLWQKIKLDFRQEYSSKLNSSIDARYRKNRFIIYFAIFDNGNVADILKMQPGDKKIKVGMDSQTHRTKGADGEYPYPNQDKIIDQILPVSHLRIGGFHLWDCVQRLARRANERGIDTLVDEDLTELFS